jgi:hypothetical protein
MISYAHVFEQLPREVKIVKKSASTAIDKNTQKAIAMINWKTKKTDTTRIYTEDFEFCNNEINKTIAKKNWNTLDKCFKWKFIDSYLKSYDWISVENIDHVKKMFIDNKLPLIKFNNKERKIITLNITVGTEII